MVNRSRLSFWRFGVKKPGRDELSGALVTRQKCCCYEESALITPSVSGGGEIKSVHTLVKKKRRGTMEGGWNKKK